MKLTQRCVDDLAVVAKPTIHFDDDLKGLGVRMMPPSSRSAHGVRTWIVEYRPRDGGRTASKRRLNLGSTSVLDAKQARSMAKDLLAEVRGGADPAATRRENRQSATVADLAETYKKEAGVGRKARTKELYEGYWRLWILPELGTLKARDVTRSDVARLHRKVGAKHPTTANRVVILLAHFYGWAGRIGGVPEGCNPAKGVERYRESSRERYLTTDEFEHLGAALTEAETVGIAWNPDTARSKHAPHPENRRTRITPHAAAAIRLLALTGARLREVLNLRWSEVDLERGLLLLPDSKSGRKTIYLGNAPLTIIAELDKVGEFVIAGQLPLKPARAAKRKSKEQEPIGPRSDLKRPWTLVSRRAGLDGVRLHDLRHSYASFGAAGGLGLPVIGALLGHKDPSTTQKYAHLGSDPLRRGSEAISSTIAEAMGRAKKRERAGE